jgi:phosphopantothenoylcysteine synthetase/decarboxylase
VLTIVTPNAGRVIAPRDLATIAGSQLVESYFDAAILPRPPDGLVVVAPCSFNSLNKLACGIADNLAMSVTAEAIGRGTPVIVAVSVNAPLLRHPRARAAMATLREWGVSVIEPIDSGDGPRMASIDAIVSDARRRV